jgi:cytochrome c peroxidase
MRDRGADGAVIVKTLSPDAPAGSNLRRRRAGRWSALLLVLALTVAAAPVSQIPGQQGPTEQEPITPVPPPPDADPLKLALGERLFSDPRLSGDGSRACTSCHDIGTNGADGNRRDKAIDGSELLLNTTTVFNAALNFRLDWEGDIRTLEAQAEAALENQRAMGKSIDEVLGKLTADPQTRRQFGEAYGHAPDRASLLDALATYERSLVTPGSRFDRWLGGDAAALSAEEQNGYRLFKSLGCVSCHQGVNVGGNLFERHGIFHPLASPKPEILRVPSLRNVATTPPYFHDGSAPTLHEAVRRMANAQLDQTLSDQQIESIVAFLNTLTGIYRGAPVSAALR